MIFYTGLSQVQKIPTVVHIIYNTNDQDLTDQQVQMLLDSINLNFKGLSTNNGISREIFDTLMVDTEIELCLTNQDPNGIYTAGIEHVNINNNLILGDFFQQYK
jgi:hypothetical protein